MLHLIGYRGCGKTTVAKLLSPQLRWPAIDADEYLERAAGRTIKEIFAAEGEAGFRDRESATVQELTRREALIVSWGGGVILRPANRDALQTSGDIVWLRARPETLLQRIEQDPTTGARRPNLTVAGGLSEVQQLVAQREPIYLATSDFQIDVDELSPEQVAQRIIAWLASRKQTSRAKGEPA